MVSCEHCKRIQEGLIILNWRLIQRNQLTGKKIRGKIASITNEFGIRFTDSNKIKMKGCLKIASSTIKRNR